MCRFKQRILSFNNWCYYYSLISILISTKNHNRIPLLWKRWEKVKFSSHGSDYKATVFWNVIPCYKCFGETCCFHLQDRLPMAASSIMLVTTSLRLSALCGANSMMMEIIIVYHACKLASFFRYPSFWQWRWIAQLLFFPKWKLATQLCSCIWRLVPRWRCSWFERFEVQNTHFIHTVLYCIFVSSILIWGRISR